MEVNCVSVSVIHRRAHGNEQVVVSVTGAHSDKVSARFIKCSCLYALGILVIIAAGTVEHTVGVVNVRPASLMVIGGLHIVFGGSGDLNELRVIFHRILCDKRHISGICVLVGVIKTVGIYKVSACAAYLLSLFVHHVNKVGDALAANVICKDTCGFTGGFQQQ